MWRPAFAFLPLSVIAIACGGTPFSAGSADSNPDASLPLVDAMDPPVDTGFDASADPDATLVDSGLADGAGGVPPADDAGDVADSSGPPDMGSADSGGALDSGGSVGGDAGGERDASGDASGGGSGDAGACVGGNLCDATHPCSSHETCCSSGLGGTMKACGTCSAVCLGASQ